MRAGARLLPGALALAVLVPAGLHAQSPGVSHDPFPVHLVFTGDINLGTRTMKDGIPPDSGRGLFRQVDSLFQGDLVIGNFEGVLSDSGESGKCPRKATRCYSFATPTWLATRLVEAGFTHLNLANNHANDFGLDGRRHTESTLRRLGMEVYGPLDQVVIQPVVRDGRMTLVGVVGFATYPHAYNLLDIGGSAAIVRELRPLVDVLVVTFHGGREGSSAVRTPNGPEALGGEPRGNLRKWARAVVDAGADAVVGHGPHVLRGVEFYRGRPVFYSLGNFLTYRGFVLDGALGWTTVLSLELNGDGTFREARMPSLRQIPQVGVAPDRSGRALTLLRRVTRLDFPKTGARFTDGGVVLAPDTTTAPPARKRGKGTERR